MKKTGIVIFCMLLLFVLTFAGNVSAYNAAYTHTLYQSAAKKGIHQLLMEHTSLTLTGLPVEEKTSGMALLSMTNGL